MIFGFSVDLGDWLGLLLASTSKWRLLPTGNPREFWAGELCDAVSLGRMMLLAASCRLGSVPITSDCGAEQASRDCAQRPSRQGVV